MTDTRRTVTIGIEAYLDIYEDEVWPDGAPDDWTVDDVRQRMEESSSVASLITDWNLGDGFTITVTDDETGDSVEVWEAR